MTERAKAGFSYFTEIHGVQVLQKLSEKLYWIPETYSEFISFEYFGGIPSTHFHYFGFLKT